MAAEKSQEPYLIETKIIEIRSYNPEYGDHRVCKCGDRYYRHFDTYDDMAPVGCKYCACDTFEEKDLFEHLEELPSDVLLVISKYEEGEGSYEICKSLLAELESLGYTFDYGLDGIPHNLRKISK